MENLRCKTDEQLHLFDDRFFVIKRYVHVEPTFEHDDFADNLPLGVDEIRRIPEPRTDEIPDIVA